MTKSVAVSRTDTPSSPAIWQSMRREMDKLFDQFSDGFTFPSLSRVENLWPSLGTELASLAIDVTEDDKAYKVTAELPGLEEKDVNVTVNDDVLLIKGEKRQQKEEKDKNHYLCERSYGAFQRSFALPIDVDRNAVTAQIAKGVLTVTMPKTAESRDVRKIDVKAA